MWPQRREQRARAHGLTVPPSLLARADKESYRSIVWDSYAQCRWVMFVHVNGARLYFDVAMAAHTTRSKMWNNRSLSRKRPSRGPTPLVAGLNPNLLHVRDRRSQQGALGEHQHIPLNMHGPRVGQRPWLLATKSRFGSCSLLQALSRRRCTVLERKDHWF